MQDTNPRTALRDALLTDLSENVTDDDVLDAVGDIGVDSTAFAAICGDRMVDFETYNRLA